MPTLTATIEINEADRRSRKRVFSQRASYGDLTKSTIEAMELARGEEIEFEFKRCFFAHIRDVVTLEMTDANNNVVTYPNVEGVVAFPVAGKVKISVPALSTISLNRVLHVIHS